MRPRARIVSSITLLLAAQSGSCAQTDLVAISRGTAASAGSGGGGASSGGKGNEGGDGSGGDGNGGDGNGGDGNGGDGGTRCAPGDLVPGDSNRSVVVDGSARGYVLHVPTGYDPTSPAALLLDFHALGGSGASQRASSLYPAALAAENVIMAFPDGARGPAGTAWNVGPCCVANVDDVAFARAVVAQVRGLACIDAKRVYAAGVLTGGGMAHYLACHAADVFAAAAPAAFDLLAENVDDCDPPRAISVISFRSEGDSRVPYAGGPSALVPGMPLTFLGAQESFKQWGNIDGCVGPPSPPDSNGCSAYSGCRDGVEVVLCTGDDAEESVGDPSIAWPLLKRHTL